MKSVRKYRRSLLGLILGIAMMATSVPAYAAEVAPENSETVEAVEARSGVIEKQVQFTQKTSMKIDVPACSTVKFTVWVSDAPNNSVLVQCNGSMVGQWWGNGKDHVWSYSYTNTTSRTYTLLFTPISGPYQQISCYVRVNYS